MKYILTAKKKGMEEIVGMTFKTKTTRKSKLIKLIRRKMEEKTSLSPDDLENVYIGKLDKHTKI